MSELDTTAPSLDSVRAALDGVDDELLSVLLRRAAMSAAVAAAKPLGPKETPLRPAREVQVLRRLLAKAPPAEADLVYEAWRAIMAASVRRQRPLDVFAGGGAEPHRQYDLARRHFGTSTRIVRTEDARSAVMKMSEAAPAVAVAPFPSHSGPGVWWPLLAESRFHNVSIIAALPARADGSDPEGAVLTTDAKLEAAGDDHSLALAFDPHHRLARALGEAGLKGKELARARTLILIGLEGFVDPGDMRLAAMGRVGLDGVRIVGCYARV